jgi:hypothetical protein
MAEVKQYAFSLEDAAVALIKQSKIHEGLWLVGFEFSLGAGNIGPSPEATKPAAFVQVNKLILTRHEEGTPKFPYVVDASKVNPAAPTTQTAGGRTTKHG